MRLGIFFIIPLECYSEYTSFDNLLARGVTISILKRMENGLLLFCPQTIFFPIFQSNFLDIILLMEYFGTFIQHFITKVTTSEVLFGIEFLIKIWQFLSGV